MARPIAGCFAYVRPTFMIPAVGMAVYGAALAPVYTFEAVTTAIHAAAVGLALFVAHLRDGYVDGHRRGEETPRLSPTAFARGIRLGGAAVVALALALVAVGSGGGSGGGGGGGIAAVSVLGLLALALAHAPYLDRHPLTVTLDYPVGIGLALVGGYAAQTGRLPPAVVWVAGVFVGLLAGIKVGIDRLDAAFDRSIGKRTVPVAFGATRAKRIAGVTFVLTALATLGLGVAGARSASLAARPPFAVGAAVVPIGCVAAVAVASDERAVQIQMGLTYVFAVLLFVAVCDGCAARPLADAALAALGRS